MQHVIELTLLRQTTAAGDDDEIKSNTINSPASNSLSASNNETRLFDAGARAVFYACMYEVEQSEKLPEQ